MHYIIKKFYVAFVLFFLVIGSSSTSNTQVQAPKLISYRGELITPQDASIDTTVSIQFSIYSDSIDGTPLWTEIQPTVKTYRGTFNVLLGSMNEIPESVYASKNRYLEVEVSDESEMTPRELISLDAELDGYVPLYNDPNSGYLGSYEEMPMFVKRVQPKYPQAAKTRGVTGTVFVELFVDENGKVKDARIYRDSHSNADLEKAAIEAAKASEFDPAIIDGQPVAVRTIVPYVFALKRKH